MLSRKGCVVTDWTNLARQSVSPDEVLTLAQRLVRIPSENPPGQTAEVCRAVAEELEPDGFEVEYLEPAEGFVSLTATYRFQEPGRRLILNGHVDVVPAPARRWTRDPWGADVEDGTLFGRGSLDMKGPLAGLIVAARSVVRASPPLRGELVVTAVADEEQGGRRGTGALVERGLSGDGVVIAEPGDGGIVLAHRGMCFVRLTTRGESGHASMPAEAVNAVDAMVDVLQACRTVQLRSEPHQLLEPPTIAIGTTISGGEQYNVIPDVCQATLDIRTVPGMTEESVLEDLRSHFARAGLEPEVETIVWGQPGETSPESEIVKVAAQAFEREFGHAPALRGMPAATDGWWFTNHARIPTVMGLAPGSIRGCHVVDEAVPVEELVRYARVYAHIVAGFLGPSPAPDS
jgi:acetylornithine deacetylase/succinyl-diaminopimelate desuccinylase family protein